jgi:hypothetical protein
VLFPASKDAGGIKKDRIKPTRRKSGRSLMTKQRTPHPQTRQDVEAEQTDLQPEQESSGLDQTISENSDTQPRKTQHRTEPQAAAYEGSLSTRTPKSSGQGITSRSAEEESARQEKVVNDRPDAQAGVNHSQK